VNTILAVIGMILLGLHLFRQYWLWQRNRYHDLYKNFARITVVVGERDDVLDNPSMIASAEQGARVNSGVSVVLTEHSNHFVSLEQPHYLREIVAS
jgi:pimeloyl-ACP methyl ester carboxylesterase